MPNNTPTTSTLDGHKVLATLGIILSAAIIIVAGIWIYIGGSNTANSVDNYTKIATNSTKTATSSAYIDTSTWKTYYKNSVSFKYPSNWKVDDSTSTIKVGKDTAATYDVLNIIPDFVGGFCEGGILKGSDIIISTFKGRQINCYLTEDGKLAEINLYFEKAVGDKPYLIRAGLNTETETIRKIISTFKFL